MKPMRKILLVLAAALLAAEARAATSFDCAGEGTFALTASTDNLNLGKVCVAKLTAPSAVNVTGIVAGNQGRLLVLYNTGSATITLSDASSSSTLGNRFATYGASTENVALPAGAGVLLFYDAGAPAWRLVSQPSSEILSLTTFTTTGAVTLSGATTLSGTVVNPLTLSATERIYTGTTTLTEAGGAETILTITTATTQATGGTLYFVIRGNDGTDTQSTTGQLRFSMVNKAGTVTSTFLPATLAAGITVESATQALSSGTMTGVFDSVEAANATVLSINIDSSLTLTSASMEWVLVLHGPGTIS